MDQPRYRRRRRGGALWLWLVLLLLLLALVLGLVFGLRDDKGGGSGNASSSGVAGTQHSSGAGTLTAGSTDVTTAPAARLATLTGRPVTAKNVRVVSVVGDEVFWVGHVLVHIETSGESAPTVRTGDRVSFRGKLVANAKNDAARFGVTDAEGAARLRREGVHVETPVASLQVG